MNIHMSSGIMSTLNTGIAIIAKRNIHLYVIMNNISTKTNDISLSLVPRVDVGPPLVALLV